MATDVQRLIVSLEAKMDAFEKAMNRANGVANRRAKQIEDRFLKMNKHMAASFRGLQSGLTFVGVGLGVKGFQELADAATRTQNSLKVAGLAGGELKGVYDALFASAQRNAVPIESLAELYGRAALVQNELKVSTGELVKFTDNVAIALRVSGKSAEESSGALLQLGQALGSGAVRSEEFNSILEGALPVAQAAAVGLKEAGGSVARLRQLVIEGKISSEAFFRAFEAGSVILEQRVANSTFTVEQKFILLKNALVDAVGKINDATGVSKLFSSALDELAGNVSGVGDYFEKNKPQIKGFFDTLAEGFASLEKWKNSFRESVGLTALDDFLEGTSLIEGRFGRLSNQIAQREADLSKGMASGLSAQALRMQGSSYKLKPLYGPFAPVSVDQFAPPSTKSTSTRGRRARDYDNEMANLQERTALLRAETDARAKLNPLAEDYERQIDRALTKQRLLTAAQQQGLKLTPELEASMDKLADGYSAASAAAETLTRQHEQLQESVQEMRALGKDVMGGFISDLREGTSAAEALGNALNRVADKMIDMALNNLFSAPGSTQPDMLQGLGGLFGFAKGGLAAHGRPLPLPRFAAGGVSRSAAIFGEAGPEAAVPLPDGRRIPVDLRLPGPPKDYARPQGVNLTVSPVFNVQNGSPDGIAKMKNEVLPQIQKLVRRELNEAFDRSARFARMGA